MAGNPNNDTGELLKAVRFARNNEWTQAHEIAQKFDHVPIANWLHAVLHKIEGDASNARYWYRQSPVRYEDFEDTGSELQAIERQLRDGAGT